MQVVAHDCHRAGRGSRADDLDGRRVVALDGLDLEVGDAGSGVGVELQGQQVAEVGIVLAPVLSGIGLQEGFERMRHLGLVRGLGHADERADEVQQQVVGHGLAVREAAALDPAWGIVLAIEACAEFGQQAALPHPRLAKNAGDATLPGFDDLE